VDARAELRFRDYDNTILVLEGEVLTFTLSSLSGFVNDFLITDEFPQNRPDYAECDTCGTMITDCNNNLYHVTGILNDEINKHIHLCGNCYHSNFKEMRIVQ